MGKKAQRKPSSGRRLPPLRKLFDRWIPEALPVFGTLKFLQFLRLLGAKAKVNGWRKVSSIFLRSETSKFILGAFRLPTDQTNAAQPNLQTVAAMLARKLADYLRASDAIRYWVEPGLFAFYRRRRRFCDLMLLKVDDFGQITEIQPFWDNNAPELGESEKQLLKQTLEMVRLSGNDVHDMPEHRRAPELLKKIRERIREASRFHYFNRRRRTWLARRILHATVLFCEILPKTSTLEESARARTCMPDFRKYRNPGLGTLGALIRLTPDLQEFDLWCQFNHVAVDGAPMQDFLSKLKRDWGSAGEFKVPPLLPSGISRTELRYAGDGMFRALFFMDFTPILQLRKKLHILCAGHIHGPVTVSGLILWGLAGQPAFEGRKMLLPVDAGSRNGDRELGLLMIRPARFRQKKRKDPLSDFCDFQSELNKRIQQARTGKGVANEFLELCALMHPFFYHLAHRIWPLALNEVLGTAALSILKESDIFISPMTAFQSGGFIGIGNLNLPTVDGKRAGAVSVTGRHEQIRECLAALRSLSRDLPIRLSGFAAAQSPEWPDSEKIE